MTGRDLTVIGHLEELRRRMIVALCALIACAAACLPFSSAILGVLRAPAGAALGPLAYFGPEEALVVYMRISIVAGLMLSVPVIAYQAWAFTAPALGKDFKRYAVYFTASTAAVFACGSAFAFFVLLPAALKFLLGIGQGQLQPVISASRYISFVTAFILACGLVFEMPVAAFFLARAGILKAGPMRRNFKYAFVVIMAAAAVITPTTDMFNMTLLALPMVALYEVSIWVAALAARKRSYV
jgi:sec-independent protein translocase protein TatC